MVTHWGMSERLGPVSYKISEEDPFLGREIHQQRQFSEHTLQLIDQEVAQILHAASEQALQTIKEHREDLEKLAATLLEKEELDDVEITDLIGPPVNPRRDGRPTTKVQAPPDKEEGRRSKVEQHMIDE
jgi:cell division protease FtsH